MDAGVLVVGNEILDGLIVDTNSNWLTGRLKALAVSVKEIMTVRDDIQEIAKGLLRMKEDSCRIVITSGGLGPTHDDMTLKGVAEAFGLPLELNEEALRIVERQYQIFYQRGMTLSPKITDARRKMAILPRGAKPLDNRVGGAPGVLLEMANLRVVCLPGVPSELRWTFDNAVLELLRKDARGSFKEAILDLPSGDESSLSPIVDEIMADLHGVYIKSMVGSNGSHMRLWVSSYADSEEEAAKRISTALDKLKMKLETG